MDAVAAVLQTQATAGNAAVTRVLARKITGSDIPALQRWGKTKDKQKEALLALGPEGAYKAIDAFCTERKRTKDTPTLADFKAYYTLADSDLAKPADAPKLVEGWSFALDMATSGKISVGLDDHQNKHQKKKIFGLKDYSGGDADNKYDTQANADWHRRTTAPLVVRWVRGLDEAGDLDPAGTVVASSTGEQFFGSGHLFVASAIKDSAGNLYGSYHCYPEVNEV
jgi:hypothetical protein